jgi:uncharacterized protein YjbI with pentapeptide repeats
MLSESDFYCESKPTPLFPERSTNQKIPNQIKRRQKRFDNGQSYPSDHILTVRGEGLYGFNFIGMKFQRVFFDSSDLGLATFDKCVGSPVTFINCSMNHAKFTNCQLTDWSFANSSLIRASFSGIFKNALFVSCYLNYADLTGAKFINCSFFNTELTGAKLSLDPAHWLGSMLPSGVTVG